MNNNSKNSLESHRKEINTKSRLKLFDNQRLITKEQLSEWLSVPIKTIQDWVYKRKIPFVKVGSLVRFRVSEIESWINEGA